MANVNVQRGRYGISDYIPALGEWLAGNRERIEAPFRQKAQQRAEGLLGDAGTSFEDFGAFGQTFDQAVEPSGLMADPNDFYNQMKYSLGLMSTPGYEQAGQQFGSQAMQHALGMNARNQAQQNWMAEQQQRQANIDAERAETQRRAGEVTTKESRAEANTLRDDFERDIADYRQSAELYTGVQNMFSQKGVGNMTIADDELLVKTLAKMILPKEAVMSQDVIALSQNQGLSSAVRAALSQIGMRTELTVEERRNLYQTIQQKGQEITQRYGDIRQDYAARSERSGVNPGDVMLRQMDIDTSNMSYAGASRRAGGRGDITPLSDEIIPDSEVIEDVMPTNQVPSPRRR